MWHDLGALLHMHDGSCRPTGGVGASRPEGPQRVLAHFVHLLLTMHVSLHV